MGTTKATTAAERAERAVIRMIRARMAAVAAKREAHLWSPLDERYSAAMDAAVTRLEARGVIRLNLRLRGYVVVAR